MHLDIASIGDAIKTNAVLEDLDIGYCEITSQGCIHIAAALSENSTLLRLAMEGNAIGVEGAKAMSEMSEKNISLKKLYLYYDHSYEEGVDVYNLISVYQRDTSDQQNLEWGGFNKVRTVCMHVCVHECMRETFDFYH